MDSLLALRCGFLAFALFHLKKASSSIAEPTIFRKMKATGEAGINYTEATASVYKSQWAPGDCARLKAASLLYQAEAS